MPTVKGGKNCPKHLKIADQIDFNDKFVAALFC